MQLRQRWNGRGATQGRVAILFLILLGIVLLALTLHSTSGTKPVISQRGCQGATSHRGSLSSQHQLPLVPPPGCLHLQDVCADQQTLVLYDPRYRPDAAEPVSLPSFQADWARYNFPFRTESNPDALGTEQLHLSPLSVRPVSSLEPTPDLQQPIFADDSVPLLFYPTWQEGFGHTLHNSMGWLYTHLTKSNASWADRASLVLYTPHGLAVKQHWQGLAAAVTPHPVRSFAEDMLVCAGDAEDHATNSWQAAQHIVRHYQPTLPKPALKLHPPLEPSQAQLEASRVSSASQEVHSNTLKTAPVVLRVVFARRDGAKIRSITNLDELELACRRWSHWDAASGRLFRASCGSWVFKDLLSSMAVAQSADVLIGIHGASIANSWFMRPGSSVVEVYPPAWLWDVHRRWLEQDPQAQLQWWGLLVEDPAAYSPGALELQMASKPRLYQGHQGPWKLQRDRNVRVPWAGIERILQEVAGAWGDGVAYRRAVGQGRQFWAASATNVSSLERPPPAYLL